MNEVLNYSKLLEAMLGCYLFEGEEIKDIPGFHGYFQITTNGRIWRTNLKVWIEPTYYKETNRFQIHLFSKRCVVYRLVMITYVGPRPSGLMVCHNPYRNPLSMRLVDLRYDTKQNNEADKRIVGTDARGENHGRAKNTEEIVREIRAKALTGKYTRQQLADDYNMCIGNIYAILDRRSWKHI